MTKEQATKIYTFMDTLEEFVFSGRPIDHTTMRCDEGAVIFIKVSGYANPIILTVTDEKVALKGPHTEYKEKSTDIKNAFVSAGL